ncbi:Precursor of CEP9, partial [Mucuna pruriens]
MYHLPSHLPFTILHSHLKHPLLYTGNHSLYPSASLVVMAKFQDMNKYFAVFLALVACHYSLLTHSREIKPFTQHSSQNKGTVMPDDSPQPLKASVNNVPISSSEKKDDSTVTPKNGVASFEYSGAAYTNAFRPTKPGNSPGVGHPKFAQEDENMKAKVAVQSPDVKVYETQGTTNAFKPTNPGHSPGVGHRKFAQEDDDMKAKVVHSPGVNVYVAEGTINAFKPTNPDHIPVIMGKFQDMNKYFAVFLALVACHDSLLTHGKEIKPLNQHSSLNKGIVVPEDNPQPLKASVNNVPISSSENKDDSTVTPKNGVASFGYSGAAYTNVFRPTPPGNSPGVGHRKFAQQDKDMKAKVAVQNPDVKVYVTEGKTNAFKPTNPGHSPGVGHAQQNKIGQLN